MRTTQFLMLVILFLTMLKTSVGQVQVNDTAQPRQLKEVLVTATRFSVDPESIGRVTTIIEGEALRAFIGLSMTEALSTLTQMHVDGDYTHPGNNLSYYMRGARNGQILVLIDGVPVKDPSDINRSYDFRNIAVGNIEKIEIVKGGLSAIYGTDAMAGVINIITKKNSGKKFDTYGGIRIGSYQALDADWGVQGAHNKWNYLLHAGYSSIHGLSAALDTNTAPLIDSVFSNPVISPFDNDPFSKVNTMLKLAYSPSSAWHIQNRTEFESYEANIDNGAYQDDINRIYTSKRFHNTLRTVAGYRKGEMQAYVSYTDIERRDKNDSVEYANGIPLYSYTSGYSNDLFRSSLIQGGITNQYKPLAYLQGQVGIEYQRASYANDGIAYGSFLGTKAGKPIGTTSFPADSAKYFQADPFVSVLLNWPKGLSTHAGYRMNYHSQYGWFPAFSISPAYSISLGQKSSVKLFGSISNALKSPTLYQLYSVYGNTNLNPEQSIAYEGGLAIYIKNIFSIQTSAFLRKESEQIIFGLATYENGGGRQVNGVDVEWTMQPCKTWRVNGFAALVHADDSTSLYRMPKTRMGLNATAIITTKANLGFSITYTGSRTIFDFATFSEVELSPYVLANIRGSYKVLNEKIALTLAINNILNQQFVAIDGFATKGVNINFGIRLVGL